MVRTLFSGEGSDSESCEWSLAWTLNLPTVVAERPVLALLNLAISPSASRLESAFCPELCLALCLAFSPAFGVTLYTRRAPLALAIIDVLELVCDISTCTSLFGHGNVGGPAK